jgi:peroxiredoxin
VVVGLDAKDFRADARAFAGRYGLTFPIVYDGPGDTTGPWGVTGFPETFVLDREGRVVEAFAGAVDGDDVRERFEAAVESALAT